MFRLVLRNLAEKKIRFALTTLTVVMGVMFVVGAFALTDSLRSTFSELASDITSGTDLTVRSVQEVGGDLDRPALPEDLVDPVARIDGVGEVLPAVAAFNVVIVDGDGEPIIPPGPPALGFNFLASQFFLIEGRAPAGGGEFAADATTAARNDLRVGEIYSVNGPLRAEDFKLVGVFNFGAPDTNTSVGQTMAAFDLPTAQRFFGLEGEVLEIGVRVSPGADPAAVQAGIEAALGGSYEVITQQIAAQEQEADFDEFVNIFNWILLVFAFIAVFVSAFIINNTFQMVLDQRVREIGLWRAIGATPRQVGWSVIGESAAVGVLSTAVGIGCGMGLSVVLRLLLRAGGFGLPSGPLELRLRTVLLAVAVGLGVTVVSSIGPALRARRISPIAALQHGYRIEAARLRRRLIVGGTMAAAGAAALMAGMFGGLDTAPTLALIGVGALATFVGINTVSPAFARPLARVLGRPMQAAFRVPGRIARENAARNPRRTASTAGALMIGLALVGLAAVVGESVERTFVRTLDSAVEADYFVRSTRQGLNPSAGFSEQAADDLEALDEIDRVVRYRFAFDSVEVDGTGRDIFAAELAAVEGHLDGDVVAGDLASADPLTSVALHVDPAADLRVGVGDTVEMTFPDNETETLTVAAVYADATIYGNWVIDVALWDEHFNRSDLAFASATIAGFSDDLGEAEQTVLLDRSRAAIDEALADYPTVTAENRVEFRQSQQTRLNSFLIVITLLLGLALVIALVGITNTLALSVFERTREIGLLRAVGMTRRQLRRSIRWEAAIVAVFGALLGVAVGVVFGVAATLALPEAFVSDVQIPWVTLAIYVAVSAAAGLIAAIGPARRAGRMNVLDAIAYE